MESLVAEKTCPRAQKISMAVQVHIELLATDPVVWRRVHLLANSTLRTLGCSISDMMDWCYHPYFFAIGDEFYTDLEADWQSDDCLDASKVRLGALAERSCEFFVKYGSDFKWRYKILIEDVFPMDPAQRYPLCVEGANAPPPWDCESPQEFEDYKRNEPTVTRKHYKWRSDWVRMYMPIDGFDPSFFNLDLINEVQLKSRRFSPRRKMQVQSVPETYRGFRGPKNI